MRADLSMHATYAGRERVLGVCHGAVVRMRGKEWVADVKGPPAQISCHGCGGAAGYHHRLPSVAFTLSLHVSLGLGRRHDYHYDTNSCAGTVAAVCAAAGDGAHHPRWRVLEGVLLRRPERERQGARRLSGLGVYKRAEGRL
jgi:hypothetical protein